jgi:hypothetical protein
MSKRTKTEAATEAPMPNASKSVSGKIAILVNLLQQPRGTTIESMMAATGWQAHSVRGAISGSIKKALGIAVISEKIDGARTYRIEAAA